jgi:putative hemolysin
LALAYPERIASLIAPPLNVLSVIAAFPVKVLTMSTEAVLWVLRVKPREGDDVSEEDVRSLVARAAATGVFTPQEHTLFQRIMRVGDLDVRDLMVPRTDIVYIEERMPIEAVRILVGTEPHSHFPVCRGGLDELIGVVHIKDLISHGLLVGTDFKVADVAQSPLFVPETAPALKVLDQFKGTRTHVAFVVDEYGSTLGLLTLNDLVAALVGDIGRRGEETVSRATPRNDGSWLLDGRLSLHKVIGYIKPASADLSELPDVTTIAGLMLAKLGHIPTEGEKTEWAGWEFEIVDMDGTRIDQVLATPMRRGATQDFTGE